MSITELYRTVGPISANEPRVESPGTGPGKPQGVSEFEKLFQRQQVAEGLKFSNHAEARIKSRSIPWNEDLERRVTSGLDSAREKGSRETLILAGDVAVIANVKSRTVITAMDAANLKEKIFTNIDSAVIV